MSAYQWQDKRLLINLHIQPRAKNDSWQGLHGDAFKLRIKAAPIDGKANTYLLGFLAQCFSVPKSQVQLISGSSSRHKRFVIESPASLPPELGILRD
ncbi:MAG: DUF167 family protein [Gammaproteobacteria bacterium]|nr:DUF167 family protein [Gammaproteobacteria bacterium]MDH5727859.1 DUF167 family protein [Gammaproteobacteria bacterium]